MKLIRLSLVAFLFLAACKSSPDGDRAKTGEAREVEAASGITYAINPENSQLEWIGTKLSTYHHGVVDIKSGNMIEVDGKLIGGEFVIDMQSIVAKDKGSESTNARLTNHLKSDDFFSSSVYPEAKFVITGVSEFRGTVSEDNIENEISEYKVSDPNSMISGNLTIRDVTKNIEFPAKVTVTDAMIQATAKFNIDRKLWGITYPGMPDDMIRDEVWFGVEIHADKTQTAGLGY